MAANFWQSTHCQRWLFSRDNLSRWRRECQGPFSSEQVSLLSDYITDIVREVTKLMGWRQTVIATALVLFKRFFVRASFEHFDPRLVVPTVLYVAGKVSSEVAYYSQMRFSGGRDGSD